MTSEDPDTYLVVSRRVVFLESSERGICLKPSLFPEYNPQIHHVILLQGAPAWDLEH